MADWRPGPGVKHESGIAHASGALVWWSRPHDMNSVHQGIGYSICEIVLMHQEQFASQFSEFNCTFNFPAIARIRPAWIALSTDHKII